MPTQQIVSEYNLSIDVLEWACKRAAQDFIRQNWYVTHKNPDKFVFHEPALHNVPIMIDLNLQPVSANKSRLIFTISRVARGHKKLADNVVQGIQQSVATAITQLATQNRKMSAQSQLTRQQKQELQDSKYRLDYKGSKVADLAHMCIYDYDGMPLLYATVQADLKNGVELYLDQDMRQKAYLLHTPETKGAARYYKVSSVMKKERIGILKQDFAKSIIVALFLTSQGSKEQWSLLDSHGNKVARVKYKEENYTVGGSFPEGYVLRAGGTKVAKIKYTHVDKNPKNPIHLRMFIEFNDQIQFDRRLGIAQAVLLCIVEHQKALKDRR